MSDNCGNPLQGLEGIIEYDLPTCKKCGHKACPYCKDWCDSLLPNDDLCCDGECTY